LGCDFSESLEERFQYGDAIMETIRTKCVHLPDLDLRKDEIRLLLAIKLLEDGLASLGKAAEVAGFSEKAFVEILVKRRVPPIRYTDVDLHEEFENA
jgi:predicted HTH domain antitoxin